MKQQIPCYNCLFPLSKTPCLQLHHNLSAIRDEVRVFIMSFQVFWRCAQELGKEEFSRVGFLRLLAQICSLQEQRQAYLALYALYQLQIRDSKGSLLAVEKGLSLQEDTLPAALLLATKAVLLTAMEKHAEALQSFKQAIQVVHLLTHAQQPIHPAHKRAFPLLAATIIRAFSFARGRREFLVLLDDIRGQVEGRTGLEPIAQAVALRMTEIRDGMRCAGKGEHERRLLLSSSSMGTLGVRPEEDSTSIYVNRLYEERRKALGQREKSAFKKSISNPYQLNLHASNTRPDCQLM